jgi:hypothetical protein
MLLACGASIAWVCGVLRYGDALWAAIIRGVGVRWLALVSSFVGSGGTVATI